MGSTRQVRGACTSEKLRRLGRECIKNGVPVNKSVL